MARKPALSIDTLTELGAEKLARLVMDEAERSPSFRRQVSAALAGKKGPQAIAGIVDRRLGALEKARGFVEWDKARGFRDDIAATVATIRSELGEASPVMAVGRLLRFIATHEQVFERVDDSSGHVQSVYYQAIAALGDLIPKLQAEDKTLLPVRIMATLGDSSHGYLIDVAREAVEHLPKEVLRDWDADLAALQDRQKATDAKSKDRHVFSNASQYLEIRQIIAGSLGDFDGLISLEEKKHLNVQDTMGIAERLLEAGRAKEALGWVRRQKSGGLRHMSASDVADGRPPRDAHSPQRTSLEARILETLGENDAAQSLRWSAFEATLDLGTLREHVLALPDFEEFVVLDRAFAHVLASKHIYAALAFLVEWPRLDLAAKLVVIHWGAWDGGQYYMLPPVADALQHDHPLAAIILYRALLDDILNRARSQAYSHAARYLKKLDALAARSDAEAASVGGIASHTDYRAGLQKSHARKSGFWSLVK